MIRPFVFCALLASTVGAAPPASAQDDTVESLLAEVERKGLASVWDVGLRLSDLDEAATNSLRGRLRDASPLARLAMARGLLELEETLDAREALLGLVGEDVDDFDVRAAAIGLLGARGFEGDREVIDRLRQELDRTFKPELQLALAKALYVVSRDDRAESAARVQEWLSSDRRDLRIQGALALAEIGDVETARRALRELEFDPTPEGALARAYLRISYLERDVERLMQKKFIERKSDPDLELFEEVVDLALRMHIQGADFAEGEGRRELIAAAANGLLSRLDPHSTFFTNEQHKRWNMDLRRDYGGIGAYVDILDQYFTITRPIFGGPAYLVGLRSGDQIHSVDGWSTEGVTDLDEIITRLKGPPGSAVDVTIYRRGWSEARPYQLSRERIVIPSVHHDLLPGGIGYLDIVTFGGETVAEVQRAVEDLKSQGMRALIVDLRFNTGGYLHSAVDLTGLFCGPEKLVVTTSGSRPADEQEFWTPPAQTAFADPSTLPMAVLVNESSASASEILTGTIRHYGRGMVIGKHTYGKGSVQTQLDLEGAPPEPFDDANLNGIFDAGESYRDLDGNGQFDPGPFVKITTARYYLPDGSSINKEYDLEGKLTQRGGIAPDIEVDVRDRFRGRTMESAPLIDTVDDSGRNVFQRYLETQYPLHTELLVALSEFDDFDESRYPEFDALYDSLNTTLSRDDVRYLLRMHLRRKVSDEMAREKPYPFPGSWVLGDLQEDPQVQAAIQQLLNTLGEEPDTHQRYAFLQGVDLRTPTPPNTAKADSTTDDRQP